MNLLGVLCPFPMLNPPSHFKLLLILLYTNLSALGLVLSLYIVNMYYTLLLKGLASTILINKLINNNIIWLTMLIILKFIRDP